MYLIESLPYELNDDLVLLLKDFELAVFHKRFWAAGQMYNKSIESISEGDLLYIIPYLVDDYQKYIAINYSVIYGFDKALQLLLLDPRIDPNVDAIQYASEMGRVEIVEILLRDPRVDPATNDNYAIRWASKNGHKDIVELLIGD